MTSKGHTPIKKIQYWLPMSLQSFLHVRRDISLLLLCYCTLYSLFFSDIVSATTHFLKANLNQPSDIAIGENGRAWVLDGVNNRVVVFSVQGEKLFSFGDTGKGKLLLPMGIAVNSTRVYIADSGNHRIVAFDHEGKYIRTIMLNDNPSPEPVALWVDDYELLWSDRRHHRVCRYNLKNNRTSHCWGKRGEAKGNFQFPLQIAVDADDYVHIVDVLNARIQQFHYSGRYVFSISRFGLEPGEVYRPNGVTFSQDKRMFVTDSYRGTVSIFSDGQFQQLLDDFNGNPLHFNTPVGIRAWNDKLFIVESGANRVSIVPLPSQHITVKKQAGKAHKTIKNATSRKNCVSCHFSWASDYTDEEGIQDNVPPVATQQMCYSCHHGAIIDSRKTINHAEQHPDVHHVRADASTLNEHVKRQEKLPEIFPLLSGKKPKAERLTCGSCHTPHNSEIEGVETLYIEHNNPWMRVLNHGGDLGQKCHESQLSNALDKKYPLNGVNHPVGIFLKQPQNIGEMGYPTESILYHGLPETLQQKGGILGVRDEMICQSCHQIHGGQSEQLLLSDTNSEELCQTCHSRHYAKNREEARKKGIHPVNIDLKIPVIINGISIKRVTCMSCHTAHEGKLNTPLLVEDHRDGKLCSHCHRDQKDIIGTDHDLRLTAKDSKNRFENNTEHSGLCGSCHSMHRSEGKQPFLYAQNLHPYIGKYLTSLRDELCLDCHRKQGIAENKSIQHFAHPYQDIIMRSDPKVLPLLNEKEQINEFGKIGCITCHDPHRWAPEDQTSEIQTSHMEKNNENPEGIIFSSFLRKRGIEGSFCIDCHGLETRVKYKYYHDALSRSKGIDYLK